MEPRGSRADTSFVRRLLLALVLAAALAAAPAGARPERYELAVLHDINQVRADHGAPPLRLSSGLAAAAAEHTNEMLRNGFFAHESPGGYPFWKRIQAHYPQTGYSYWSAGENLVWSSPSLSPSEAIQMWLDSPPHRRTLLDPRWREIGLSAMHERGAPGVYGGLEVTVLTADFGVRR